MEGVVTQINGGILINVDASVIPACNCENGKYLTSIMDGSATMCDKIMEETVPTNLNKNKANCKLQNFYIYY